MCMVLHRYLKNVNMDELEQRTMDFSYEHIRHMEDMHECGASIRIISNTLDDLDTGFAFAFDVTGHPRPFCTYSYAYPRFRDYHVLDDTIKSGYAYQQGKNIWSGT